MNRFLFLLSLIFLLPSLTAQAEIVHWQDPDTGVYLNYPDRWARVHNQKPDEILSVAAPGIGDFAGCRLRVRQDDRFLIYPREYAGNIQRTSYETAFWNDYLREHDEAGITSYSHGGFGRGFGSVIEAGYRSAVGSKIWKRALIAAAPYYDKVYILECSAAVDAYPKWTVGFTNILRSVDFEKIIHDHPNGEYRRFTGDGELRIHGRKPKHLYVQ